MDQHREPELVQRPVTALRLISLAVTTFLIFALAIVAAEPSSAAGTYRTTATVRVHSIAITGLTGTGFSVIGYKPNGAVFTLLCQTQGSSSIIGGNSTWDKVTFADGMTGAISDYYTSTPSFNSYAPGTGACSSVAPLPGGGALGSLGGVDMQRACDTQYPRRGLRASATNTSSAYSWKCVGAGVSVGIDVSKECGTQYGYGAVSALSNPSSAWSWYCQWNVTSQMRAAANWAVSEKNSPNPAWSDHFGHYWSGWCEQFAEQAEGFQFRSNRAIDSYSAELNAGRIHTDTNPPVGALVFYGGGNGSGHVAVSIGNGQEIGTLGEPGQRLPVSQYPVTGYLSNPYLGWAVPFGS